MEFAFKQLKQELEVSRIASLHCFEFTKGYANQSHSHPFCELLYVDQGCLQVESATYCGELKAKQLLIHRGGEPHAFSCAPGQTTGVIILGFECDCAELLPLAGAPVELSAQMQSQLGDILLAGQAVFAPPYDVPHIADMKKREDIPFGAEQLLRLKIEQLLLCLIQAYRTGAGLTDRTTSREKMDGVKNYLERYYRENINLYQLCFLFNTNKTTLCQQFRRAYGCTIIEYVSQLRVREAKEMLREGRFNVSEIASQLGFSSVHYFSRMFKQHIGLSPTAYKQACKEGNPPV